MISQSINYIPSNNNKNKNEKVGCWFACLSFVFSLGLRRHFVCHLLELHLLFWVVHVVVERVASAERQRDGPADRRRHSCVSILAAPAR